MMLLWGISPCLLCHQQRYTVHEKEQELLKAQGLVLPRVLLEEKFDICGSLRCHVFKCPSMISSQHSLSSLHVWPAFARLFVIKIIKLTGLKTETQQIKQIKQFTLWWV